jgi:DNA-binding SARP family transcriptional activator
MDPAFRLLGPIAVLEEGREVPIGAPRLRTLLSALLVNANQTVTFSELVLWLWGGEPPAQPQRALHTAVSRLRSVLGPKAALQTVTGGYRLDVADEQLDLSRFRALAAAGTLEDLQAALQLWEGEALTGALDYPVVRDQREVLQEEWIRVTEQLIDARLALQEHAELVPELTALTKQYPLRERFWGSTPVRRSAASTWPCWPGRTRDRRRLPGSGRCIGSSRSTSETSSAGRKKSTPSWTG